MVPVAGSIAGQGEIEMAKHEPTGLEWMYEENEADERAEAENTEDERAARFDDGLREFLYIDCE